MTIKKLYILLLKKLEIGSAIAVRLTKYTGKSTVFIHPKHFLTQKPWYISSLKKGDAILDLGSGNGQSAIKASRYVKKVVGLEIDDGLIEIAKKSIKIEKLKNVNFIKADLEKNLDFKNDSFDKILFLDVLEHLASRDQILKEIKRILKPNGVLLVSIPNKDTSWKKLQKSVGINYYSDPDHKIEFGKRDIEVLLEKHGFNIQKFSYAPVDTPFRGLYDIVGAFSISIYKIISTRRSNESLKRPKDASGFEILAINTK